MNNTMMLYKYFSHTHHLLYPTFEKELAATTFLSVFFRQLGRNSKRYKKREEEEVRRRK